LLKHDPEFMQQVVIPHLRNKSPRQLVDDWILEQNLDGYLAPWRYEQLNSLERILLAKRFPEKQSGLVRLMDDDLKRHTRLFDLEATLFAQGLDTGSLGLESAGVVNLSDAIDGIQPERLSGGLKPGAPGFAAPGGAGGGMGGMGGGGMGGMPGSGGTDSYDRRLRMRGVEPLGRTLSEGKESRLFEKQEEGEVGRDKSQIDRFGMDGSGKFSAESDMPALAKKRDEEVKNGAVSEYDIASEDFRVYSRRDLVRLERKQLQLYEPLAATSKWAESQFDHIQLAEQNPSLVTPSLFWVDVLKNPKNALSEHLHLTARNGNEALLALANAPAPP
jgi:hypothetical protein